MPASNILVVEDEPHILTLIASVIQMHQAEASLAPNGSRALVLARETPFLGAIVDFSLPDMSGVEVGAQLLEIQPQLAGKLLYISGFEPTPEERAVMAEQEADFLAKPFELTAIQAAVARLIGK
ncbi:MAG: response regulator [Calditrichaeota bacterium]|nr:MAG: response regulator [Calditrichota bacterium]